MNNQPYADLLKLLIESLPSIVLAIVAAFAGSVFYARQVRAELQKEFESRFNERKWTTYTDFVNMIRDLLESVKAGKTEQKIDKFATRQREFVAALWLTGSDDVVDAYNKWQRHLRSGDIKLYPMLVEMADVVIKMRKDLGYKTTGITPDALIETIVIDLSDIKK